MTRVERRARRRAVRAICRLEHRRHRSTVWFVRHLVRCDAAYDAMMAQLARHRGNAPPITGNRLVFDVRS